MQLSIGVPAYNQGDFLRETLESILTQDEPFFEIVVANNHSTDSTAEVLVQAQADFPNRIRVVMPPAHLTMAQNWNFTASQLTGDWFSLLSSDDLARRNFVTGVKAAAALSKDAVLVRGAWANMRPDAPLEPRYLLSVAPVTKLPRTLYEQRHGPKCSFAAFALRHDVWKETGGFPEDVTLVGDWGMWLMAGARGDIVYAKEIIANYRIGHQSDVIRKRTHVLMREVFMVYQTLLPRATRAAGLGEPAWIQQASREKFLEALKNCSREFAGAEREPLIEAFRPWAASVGEQALFDRFAQGAVLREWSPLQWVRPALRRLVSVVKAGE